MTIFDQLFFVKRDLKVETFQYNKLNSLTSCFKKLKMTHIFEIIILIIEYGWNQKLFDSDKKSLKLKSKPPMKVTG